MRETERGPRGGLRRTMLAGMTALLLGFAGPVLAEAPAARRGGDVLAPASPEEVGLSSERLKGIGRVIEAEVAAGRLPGAVVMIARHGRLAFAESFGFRDRPAGEPLAKDAIFRIYSMTKPLVSVGAMMLVEDGALQLTDPVAKHLPDFKDLKVAVQKPNALGEVAYDLVPAERAPTVQDLLRHTAGLAYGEITTNPLVKAAYVKAGLYKPDFDYNTTDLTPEEFTSRIAAAPLAYQPGTVWQYSLAVDVLGRVIEKVSGKRLGAFLEERLFRPLGMTETGFSVPPEKAGRIALPLATDPATGAPNRLIDGAVPRNDSGGAGGYGTAADYLRFAQAMLDGGRLAGTRILSRKSVELMTSDHLGERIRPVATPGDLLMGVPGYTFGLGFMVRKEAGIAGVPGSAGEFIWAGYAGTFFWVDPREDLAVVIMTQAPGPSRAFYRRAFKQLVYAAIAD
ncbi:beta-lactamase [Methylobacterium sp. 4-46]|uniref:serine hydrolase domain-containing protein n=1 Tax=unclassified Methylobacterium TaxID=2615210 RepID=UPI000152C65D|nr:MULTISPECIES: serine hydrolase domain-containing protein [Methylobacterium]ACA17133.1 beta-lactamase [Methylobacterium sp. 4-46]WFT82817.1 serine hydrolase [Methylobacterium nodulans]